MICPNCGREVPNGSRCICMDNAMGFWDAPAVNVVKTIGSSGRMLAIVILTTLSCLVALILPFVLFGVISDNSMMVQLSMIPPLAEIVSSIQNMIDTVAAVTLISGLVAAIPSLLKVLAVWLHYKACRLKSEPGITTGGLTIWKIMYWITLIADILSALLAVVYFIILLVGANLFAAELVPQGATVVFTVVLIFLFLILAAVLVLAIIFHIQMIRLINGAKYVSETNAPPPPVSGFPVTLCYISGVLSILEGPTGWIRGALSILMGSCINRYRKEMRLLSGGGPVPVTPAYPQGYPQYIPQQSAVPANYPPVLPGYGQPAPNANQGPPSNDLRPF